MTHMRTEIIKLNKRNLKKTLQRAAEHLSQGELVVFPTETVYGIGANALNEKAVKKIFAAKGRPADNPCIVHIAELRQLKVLAENVNPLEKKLAKKFWPGPLTIILKKKKNISRIVSGGLSTVAVRMPRHTFARSLITAVGAPLAAPSANLSGRPSGTTAKDVYADLKGKVPLIIDAGPTAIGLESTVVKIKGNKIYILRPGAVTKETLEKKVGIPAIYARGRALRASPGTRYRHYAPRAKVEILENASVLAQRAEDLKKKKIKFGTLKYKNLKLMSRNLYADLRKLDRRGARVILALAPKESGLGFAISDRLARASVR